MLQLRRILNCHHVMNHPLRQLRLVFHPITHTMTMTFGMSLCLQQRLHLNLVLHHAPLVDAYKQKAQLQIDHMAHQGQGDIVVLLLSQRMAQRVTSLLTMQRTSGHSLKNWRGKIIVWYASESLNDVICSLLVLMRYRRIHASNSEHERTTFKPGSSTTTLRAHLSRFHLDEWVEYCDKHGIPTKWKDTEAAVNSYRQKHGQKSESSKPTEHKKFSNEAFVDALAAFIVQDDQVRFRLTCTVFH